MPKLLILFILITMPFAFAQNSNVPNITINSVILAQGDELQLTASNLSEGSYKLAINSPSGQIISQDIDTENGNLDYALNLDESGNWSINLSGHGLDTAMQVSVMPLANPIVSTEAEELNTNEDVTENQESTEVVINTTEETIVATDTELSISNETTEIVISEDLELSITDENANISVTTGTENSAISNDLSSTPEVSMETNELVTTVEELATEISDAITTGEADSETVEVAITQETQEININTESAEITVTEEIITTAGDIQGISTDTTELITEELNIENSETATVIETTTGDNNEDISTEQSISTNQDIASETTVTNTTEETQAESTDVQATEADQARAFTPLSNAPIDFSIVDSNLLAKQTDNAIWSLDFAANSGETASDIIQQEDIVYLGHGNSLLRIDSKTGKILARWLLSGQIVSLSESNDLISIDVKIDNNTTENFILGNNTLDRIPLFNSNPNLYSWLENEANVANPAARLAQDSTNPWLYLKAGQANADSTEAKGLYNNALATSNSFYDAAGISRQLLDEGQNALSTKAFSMALNDFAARGYDPRLLTDMDLHESYNFPLKALNTAVAQGNSAKATVLAEQLKYFLSPNSPEVRASLVNYADLLKQNGNKDEANNWRKIAKSSNQTTISNVLDKIFASLANVAWYAALATLLSTLALHLVLLFKYWKPQSVILNRKREAGKKPSPVARLLAIRYYSTTEKLVLSLILATTVLLAGLGTWNDKASDLPKAISSGNYANASVQNFVNTANLSTQQGAFIKAYAAQAKNQISDAEKYYKEAGNLPQALNNLAILTNDSSLFTETLKYAKNLPEALLNSGKEVTGFDFQKDFLNNSPVLSVPNKEDFQAALSGSWQDATAKTFTSTYLLNANPFGLNPIVWKIILGLFAIYTLINLLWILWPRPRMARNAPRSFLYNILSFLIPGSGMADEMWGILLLLPWAIFGLDAISRFFGLGFEINGLSLRLDYFVLGAIYIINLISIVVEFLSYRRRMNKLKEDDLDLAREFNLI